MQENQTLIDFASRALVKVDLYLKKTLPDLVIVHGDTSTALYGALAAYYNKIKIGRIYIQCALINYTDNLNNYLQT
jgi:UDP-N-acetylglucosamine 2-epimerase (non-hydrolysing)